MPRPVPSSRRGRSSHLRASSHGVPSPTAASSHAQLAGLIVRLPPKHEIENPSELIPKDGYDHPFVILSPVLADGLVTVLPMTSFQCRDLQTKFPRNAAKRKHYLPVAPAQAHPDTKELLHLRDPCWMEMPKLSYVNTGSRYDGIPFAILKPFWGQHGSGMLLAADSYQLVIERVRYQAPLAPPVAPPRVPGEWPPEITVGGLTAGAEPAPAGRGRYAAPETDAEWAQLPSMLSVRPAAPAPQTPRYVPSLFYYDEDYIIELDGSLESPPAYRPRASYGTLPVSRPSRRPPMWSPPPSSRNVWELPSISGGAAGPWLPPGFVSGLVKFVLWASAVALVVYGGYLGVMKSIEIAQLCWNWVKGSVGTVADAIGGAFRGVHESIVSAENGIQGAWEAVVGWVRRVVGSLEV